MPTRIGGPRRNSYFSAAAASVVDESSTGPSISVLSNGIVEIYPTSGDLESKNMTARIVEKPPKLEDMVLSSTSNTTRNTDFVGGSNSHADELSTNTAEDQRKSFEECDHDAGITNVRGDPLDFSVRRPGEAVSWSDSEGSTYVSEIEDQKTEIPLIHGHPSVESNRPVKSSSLIPKPDTNDGELFDVELGIDRADGYAADYISSTTKDDSTACVDRTMDGSERSLASNRPMIETKARPEVERCELKVKFQAKAGTPKTTKPMQEIIGTRQELGHDPAGKRAGGPLSCNLSYSASVTTQNDSNHLEHVDYYSHVDVASTSDDISEVCFLSKEATSTIFCRRLIPLVIPVKRHQQDDVSAVSTVNESSVMPSVMAGDNSEKVKKIRQATTTKNERKYKKGVVAVSAARLSNVDYLSAVDFASKEQDQDISTVACKLPYNVAHAAFDRNRSVPRVVPVRNDQDEVSTIHGSVSQKAKFVEICILSKKSTLSSLDSSSFESEVSEIRDMYGDEGSDDAVRSKKDPSKMIKSRAPRAIEVHGPNVPGGGRDDAVRSAKETTKKSLKPKKKGNADKVERHNDILEPRKPHNKRKKPKYGKIDHSGCPIENTAKPQTEASDVRCSLPSHARSKQPSQGSDEDESPTDARIRVLKQRIRAMQESSTLSDQSSNPNHQSTIQATKRTKGKDDEEKRGKTAGRDSKDESVCRNTLTGTNEDFEETPISTSDGTSKNQFSGGATRPEHDGERTGDIHDWLHLRNVDYLDNVEIASNNHDISTVDVRISQEAAKSAFMRYMVPTEVPLENMDDVSAIDSNHGKIQTVTSGRPADIESGLPRHPNKDYPPASTDQHHGSRPSFSDVKEDRGLADYCLRESRRRVFDSGIAIQDIALEQWAKHMDGRSTNEKIVIIIIGLSFFVLLFLLFAAIAKRGKQS